MEYNLDLFPDGMGSIHDFLQKITGWWLNSLEKSFNESSSLSLDKFMSDYFPSIYVLLAARRFLFVSKAKRSVILN